MTTIFTLVFSRNIILKRNLFAHIKAIHEDRKTYKCDKCGKLFTKASNLKAHIHIVHEDNKDHKCESCGKSFSQADKLKTHIHAVHAPRPKR